MKSWRYGYHRFKPDLHGFSTRPSDENNLLIFLTCLMWTNYLVIIQVLNL